VCQCHTANCYVRTCPYSVAEWLACWTQAHKGLGSNRSSDAVSNSLRQTVHTHCVSVHHAAKLVAALLRVAGVTAGLAKSNGSHTAGFMTHFACRLTAENRDQLRNPTLDDRVWATFSSRQRTVAANVFRCDARNDNVQHKLV